MMQENTTNQPKRGWKKAVRILSFGIVLGLALLVIAHFAWKYSGSNKWELVLNKDGVKVYAMKSPGSTLKKFKAITHIKTTLNRIVAGMTDTSSEACAEFAPGCSSGEILEPWNPENPSYVQAYRVIFPRPFGPRDLIVKTQFSQDSQTKAVLVQCTALPDRLPPNSCCRRVTNLHNSWKYTPVGNGEIEVEFLADFDEGIPYVLFNRAGPKAFSHLLPRLEPFFNKEKYQNREFAFLKSANDARLESATAASLNKNASARPDSVKQASQ